MNQQYVKNQFPQEMPVEQGEWMYFPQAMEATGITERSLRRYMQMGQVRYRKLGKSANARVQLFITDELRKIRLKDTQEQEQVFSAAADVAFDAEPSDLDVSEETLNGEYDDSSWLNTERERLRMFAEEMMAPLLQTIREQERQLQDQSRQIRLLPDLEKQAEAERKAKEMAALEAEALKKQIAAMNELIQEQQKPWWQKLFFAQSPAQNINE